jgi:SnoaL-like domain
VRVLKTPSGATAQAHVVVATPGGPGRPTTVSQVGEYRDELVKAGDGWRIGSRTFTPR